MPQASYIGMFWMSDGFNGSLYSVQAQKISARRCVFHMFYCTGDTVKPRYCLRRPPSPSRASCSLNSECMGACMYAYVRVLVCTRVQVPCTCVRAMCAMRGLTYNIRTILLQYAFCSCTRYSVLCRTLCLLTQSYCRKAMLYNC